MPPQIGRAWTANPCLAHGLCHIPGLQIDSNQAIPLRRSDRVVVSGRLAGRSRGAPSAFGAASQAYHRSGSKSIPSGQPVFAAFTSPRHSASEPLSRLLFGPTRVRRFFVNSLLSLEREEQNRLSPLFSSLEGLCLPEHPFLSHKKRVCCASYNSNPIRPLSWLMTLALLSACGLPAPT